MTNKDFAYNLFNRMIRVAESEVISFVANQELDVEAKEDKTVVTALDKRLDLVLSEIAVENGFDVVSEEGEQHLKIVRSGNYLTIDPLDGTSAFIRHFNGAISEGIKSHLCKRLIESPASDYALLLGIVEEVRP